MSMNNWRDFERAIDQELFELFDKTSAETIDRDIDQASLLVGRTLKVPPK